MISLSVYKVIHLLGIFMLFLALGGVLLHAINGGTKAGNRGRALTAATHGVGMLLILVAGFGMLARLGIGWPWPGWIWGKMLVWLLLGGMLAVAYRKGDKGYALWIVSLLLGLGAAYLALMKPF